MCRQFRAKRNHLFIGHAVGCGHIHLDDLVCVVVVATTVVFWMNPLDDAFFHSKQPYGTRKVSTVGIEVDTGFADIHLRGIILHIDAGHIRRPYNHRLAVGGCRSTNAVELFGVRSADSLQDDALPVFTFGGKDVLVKEQTSSDPAAHQSAFKFSHKKTSRFCM